MTTEITHNFQILLHLKTGHTLDNILVSMGQCQKDEDCKEETHICQDNVCLKGKEQDCTVKYRTCYIRVSQGQSV